MKAVKNKSRLMMGLKKSKADLSTVKFIFVYGSTYSDQCSYNFENFQSIFDNKHFDELKKTVLYLHGYLEDANVESVRVIAEAYLTRSDTNIIILEWGELADGNYMFDAKVNINQLGPVLAKTLIQMFNNGLDIDKFHIVGHSLGGQLAGLIGREVYKRSNRVSMIKRITALDPAFPLFYACGLATHLNKNDAEFVDVIHTDAWIYGAPVSTGTADFWPNSGKTLQPGCPKRNYKMLSDNDLSSHRRSWWFWAESVSNKFADEFEAVKARSWSEFKNGKIIPSNEDTKVVMGYYCPTNISGDYYLQTNGKTPFARGQLGLQYVDPRKLIGYECDN